PGRERRGQRASELAGPGDEGKHDDERAEPEEGDGHSGELRVRGLLDRLAATAPSADERFRLISEVGEIAGDRNPAQGEHRDTRPKDAITHRRIALSLR